MERCLYLEDHKCIQLLGTSKTIYRCALSNTLLKSVDLKEKWACKGCIIPEVMSKRPCKHLRPHKLFLIRGSSFTWFSCEQFNVTMEVLDFCHFNCKVYEPITL